MKFSIVTPSLNQAEYLCLARDSVFSQAGDFEIEWLVVDGGSTDATRTVLEGLEDSRVRWISEPDDGQSDAFNKGEQMATGDVIGWLNSDDLYLPGAFAAVAEAMAAEPARGWLVGNCRVVDREGQEIRRFVSRHRRRALQRYSQRRLLRQNFIAYNGVFWRRGLLPEIGPVDVSLEYAMDYDRWLRLARTGDPICLDTELAVFRQYDESKSGLPKRRQFDEDLDVARRYAAGDRMSMAVHALNNEAIIFAYRLLPLLGL
jgi:glycosyltransferase involved in cell wall biosynthesis